MLPVPLAHLLADVYAADKLIDSLPFPRGKKNVLRLALSHARLLADECERLEKSNAERLAACADALTLVATMQGMPPSGELIEEVREKLEAAIAKGQRRAT